jgi:hypothetical protein
MWQDVFCGICGTKLEEIRKCPSCEYTLFLSDRFCRKCGKVVGDKALRAGVDAMEAEVEKDDEIPF